LATIGSYRIIDSAGEGGEGHVLRARTGDGRDVALKVRSGDATAEAEALTRAGAHPNLPRLLDAFWHDGAHVLALEWIDGVRLSTLVEVEGPLEFARVLAVAEDVAAALEHLHAAGLVHLDVKPSNVIVNGDRAVLVDLGITQPSIGGDATRGSAGFRAPELAWGALPTARSDVYGLAATIATQLGGGAVQPGAQPSWPTVPAQHQERVRRTLRAALSTDPIGRPATPAALIDALRPPAVPTNVVALTRSPIGRAADVAAVRTMLEVGKDVAIVGASGMGKSTLANAIAVAAQTDFIDGVWWIDAASATDLGEELRRVSGADPIAALAGTSSLVIIDGAEHRADACARLMETIPRVRCLMTSIDAIPGTQSYPLGPLSLPSEEDALDPASLARIPAVAVLLSNIEASGADASVSASNAPSLVTLTRATGGSPLGLRVAAALYAERGPAIAAARAAEILDHALAGGPTLRQVLDSSISLLSPDEAVLFRRLSIFQGGFTAAAAALVCDADAAHVAALAHRGLVTADDRADDRYLMHGLIQTYAGELCSRAGETERMRAWHGAWMELYTYGCHSRDLATWDPSVTLEAQLEIPNIHAAIDNALDDDRVGTAVAIAGYAFELWDQTGRLREGLVLNRAVSAHPAAAEHQPSFDRVRAATATFLSDLGELEEASTIIAALANSARARGNDDALLTMLNTQAGLAFAQGDLDGALQLVEEAIELAMKLGSVAKAAMLTSNLMQVLTSLDDFDGAIAAHAHVVPLLRQDEYRVALDCVLIEPLWLAGRIDEAFHLAEQALIAARGTADVYVLESATSLALMHAVAGAPRQAAAYLEQALPLAESRQEPALQVANLVVASALAAEAAAYGVARSLAAQAAELCARLGVSAEEFYQPGRAVTILAERRDVALAAAPPGVVPSTVMDAITAARGI
jgi:predicted ATPase